MDEQTYIYDYKKKKLKDNFEVVFGTKNYFFMLMPSFRKLQHNGD